MTFKFQAQIVCFLYSSWFAGMGPGGEVPWFRCSRAEEALERLPPSAKFQFVLNKALSYFLSRLSTPFRVSLPSSTRWLMVFSRLSFWPRKLSSPQKNSASVPGPTWEPVTGS